MNAFDRAMNHLDKAYSFSDNEHTYVSRKVDGSLDRFDLVGCFGAFFRNSAAQARAGHRSARPGAMAGRLCVLSSYSMSCWAF